MKVLRRMRPHSRMGWAVVAASILAVGVASVATGATGDVIRIGKRTAGNGSTAIVGNTGAFATRQSNARNGDGGAASYGCRADSGREPCLYVLNHSSSGSVFKFQSNGGTAGRIDVRPPTGKTADDAAPFTTNATGVATGLNADEVDGQSAAEIIAASRPLFARVNDNGTLAGNSRGLAGTTPVTRTGEGAYTVTFSTDVSGCAYSVTESTTNNAGAASAAPVTGNVNQVAVVTRQGGGEDGTGASGRADRPFHLVVNC
jgi:hypothetical protein